MIDQIKYLHRLLSARAYLRTALLNIDFARAYLPKNSLYEEIAIARQIIEELLHRVEHEVMNMIIDQSRKQELETSKAYEIIKKVIFGESSYSTPE